jgi:hypothetical protein
MSLSRWSHTLLAIFMVAGCKSEKPSVPPTQAPSTPATGTAPAKAPAPAPVPTPAPALALSYLKPSDPERCEWLRQPVPTGEPTQVFSFNAACDRSMVSWSPDGKEGLVFTWPSGEGEVPKAWRVDLTARAGKPLDLKALPGGTGSGGQDQPYIEQIAFDKQGRPVAIIADVYVSRKTQKGADGQTVVTFEGKRYPLPEGVEGSPGLAHAYRLEEGGWKHFEAKGSGFESGLAPGTSMLDALKTLMPVAKASAPEQELPGNEAPEAAVKKLDATFPGQDESGQWMVLNAPGGPIYYRGTLGGEFLYPSAPIAWEQEGKVVAPDGLWVKPNDFIGLRLQDEWLLIANYGTPRSAQVWNTRTRDRVIAAEDANAPAFWPKPGGP